MPCVQGTAACLVVRTTTLRSLILPLFSLAIYTSLKQVPTFTDFREAFTKIQDVQWVLIGSKNSEHWYVSGSVLLPDTLVAISV